MKQLKIWKSIYKENNRKRFYEASIGKHNQTKALELYRKLFQKRLKKVVSCSGNISDMILKDGKPLAGIFYYIGNKQKIRLNILPTSSSIQLYSIDFWIKPAYNPQFTLSCKSLNVIQILDLIVDTIQNPTIQKTQVFTEGLSASKKMQVIIDWLSAINKEVDYLKNNKIAGLYRDFQKWDVRFGKSGISDQTFRMAVASVLTGKGIKHKDTVIVSVDKAEKEKPILTSEEKEIQKELEQYRIKEEDLKGSIQLLKHLVEGLGVITNGIIVTGTPGVGKTYTTVDVLENVMGKKLDFDYITVTGTISPIEMFKTMHDNRDAVIIFDDCDEIFKNQDSVNMLKGALQTQGLRRVSYIKASITGKKDEEGTTLFENPFEFNGQIVMITNFKTSELSRIAPIEDRVNQVHFNISQKDLIDYVEEMLQHIYKDVSMDIKKYVFNYFKKFGPYYKSAQKKGISIRSYTKTLDLVVSGKPEEVWKSLAINTL